MKQIKLDTSVNGRQPFAQWMDKLKDRTLLNKIHQRLTFMEKGYMPDVKQVSTGIYETRIHSHGGVRIYFYQHGSVIIILLCGGNKATQKKDIAKAIEYTEDFRRRYE